MQRGTDRSPDIRSEVDRSGVRQRHPPPKDDQQTKQSTVTSDTRDNEEKDRKTRAGMKLSTGTYWLTRIILLRYVAFIYFMGFLVAFHQNSALLGKNGLLPADKYLQAIKQRAGDKLIDAAQYAPTLLWLVDYEHHIDWWMSAISVAGLVLSAMVVVRGAANIPVMLCLWLLYHSLVNVGQRWYSFGWESQLLETGFLAAFLCPLLSLRRLPRGTPTSRIVIFAFVWLIFRIMLGAGLIKIRGDKCWWPDLTCMNYHYETQPVPNPISYYMHQEPVVFHKFETMTNHFVELVAPFLMLLTRRPRMVGGFIQIFFQVVLIVSGNLSFLNWLTIAPSLACFDDASLSWMFSSNSHGSTKWQVYQIQQQDKFSKRKLQWFNYVRRVFNISLGILLAYLSIPIVQNLLSSRQIMNTSFDPMRIVNTYGAFGSITKERTEVIFQGTYDDPNDLNAKWEEYEFKCKPGSVGRRPCLISPYHYRLDWLMWFAAFQNYQYNNWLVHLAAKFLVNDEGATSLIAHNPFHGREPPKFVRAEHFRYQFNKIGSKSANWWKRTKIGNYLPVVSLESLTQFLKSSGWSTPRLPKRRKSL